MTTAAASSSTKTSKLAPLVTIKLHARGRWLEIVSALTSIAPDLLDSRKHPCPKCGGEDRFRAYDDFNQEGGAVCSHCNPPDKKNADGFAFIQWANGWSFPDTVRAVAEHLGLSEPGRTKPKPAPLPAFVPPKEQPGKESKPHPAADLEFQAYSDALAAIWCVKKSPIKPEALKRFGARIAKYKGRFVVIALPIFGPELAAGDPVGWIVYNITGGSLPSRDGPVSKKVTWGSSTGVVGLVDRLRDPAARKIKTEGPTDALALLSADLDTTDCIICNACGAIENPDKEEFRFLSSLVAGSQVISIGDADKAGQDGVAKWANAFAQHAAESRIVRLPYEVVPSHGKDLRNWLAEGNSREAFEQLIAAGEVVSFEPPQEKAKANELPEDPHRLARANVEAYRAEHGGELRFWRGQWLKWNRKCNRYQFLTKEEIESKVNARIKIEFDKQWEIDHKRHLELYATDPDYKQDPPSVRRVTAPIVRDTLAALRSLCTISSSVEMGTWIQSKERRKYLACRNHILDLSAFLADGTVESACLEHSPNWFSTVCLGYDFDPTADCPIWDEFLNELIGDDQDKLKLLQEFAGYILSPSNTRSKFLALEGDGGRGKSAVCNAFHALLGDNVSSVPLEELGKRFQSFPTLGKMLNICEEANDIDAPAESFLKNFTGGGSMMFESKGVNPIAALPTAKLLLTWNIPPRFKDRSEGLWRRMLVIRFNRKPARPNPAILEPDFWEREGQLPGMLNWALLGLKRLEDQREFTITAESKQATEDIRTANNSARLFIVETYEYCEGMIVDNAYKEYSEWCVDSGMHPVNASHFGRELNQVFRDKGEIEKSRGTDPLTKRRYWRYRNIRKRSDPKEQF